MTSAEVLRRIVDALDSAGIPFMLTGSFAAAFHGVARATLEIDLVIDATELSTTSSSALPRSRM